VGNYVVDGVMLIAHVVNFFGPFSFVFLRFSQFLLKHFQLRSSGRQAAPET